MKVANEKINCELTLYAMDLLIDYSRDYSNWFIITHKLFFFV